MNQNIDLKSSQNAVLDEIFNDKNKENKRIRKYNIYRSSRKTLE